MHTIVPRLGLIVCLCFSILCTSSGGVPADSVAKVEIRWLQSPWTLPTPLQHETTAHLVQWLRTRGIAVADKADRIFWCDVYTFDGPDSNNVVLSVGVGQTLPARVIEFGKKAEVLYSGTSAKKKTALPKEGKWVRESLSEDFLYQYMQPLDHKLVIVAKSHLFERLDEIAELLYQRHFGR
jgi:hypothetical protein